MKGEACRFADHVNHVVIDNELILFDSHKGHYWIFDAKKSEYIIKHLMGDLRHNNNELANYLYKRKLIIASKNKQIFNYYKGEHLGIDNYEWRLNSHHIDSRYSRSIIVLAFIKLLKVKIILSLFGLGYMLRHMTKLKTRAGMICTHGGQWQKMLSINTALRHVAPFLPFRVACLEHSLALFQFLVKVNNDTRFFIGVQNYSFLSHAWVQVGDIVIGDRSDLQIKLALVFKL
ncbi:lasso peptide biosynthesis B2 protein [Martelella alba]|uniref:Lasso peptide biosynthesis B2 protein n=1 Tax=Martelella alba TaxID=2590451 RepID=A0ABY2SQ83_9HYPH|nr:lasso peptide biosynthesis B2 protein [Martelella alba]TKI07482.1 lasso peptide biosynthesis B2 protein [Martelella alba]